MINTTSIRITLVALALSVAAGTAFAQTAPGAEKKDEAGGVTVTARYLGQTPQAVRFQVKLDTHTADLGQFDLKSSVTLRNDAGAAVRPLDPKALGGHHAQGELAFPATDSAGRAVVGESTRYLELVVVNLAGVPERVLRWDVR
jgi:hypothetical protein